MPNHVLYYESIATTYMPRLIFFSPKKNLYDFSYFPIWEISKNMTVILKDNKMQSPISSQ